MGGTTWYLHGDNNSLLYEKEVKANGITEQRHYLQAAGMTFALAVTRVGAGISSTSADPAKRPTQLCYYQQDHLGSIAAITDEAGQVIERLAYDPWGKRRYANGLADTADSIVGVNTDRGYTLHEHLDEVGVIHMNGRVYDPLVGRFMSADPFVQAPGNLQSYNRYAYVMNNPLALTDPSGYISLRGLLRAVDNFRRDVIRETGKAINTVLSPLPSWAQGVAIGGASVFACGPAAPACAAAMTAQVVGTAAYGAGASSSDALRAGAIAGGTAYAFSWAGDVYANGANPVGGYAAHGAVGCASFVASGSNCAQGAAAAVFGKFATVAIGGTPGQFNGYQMVATMVAGGVGSMIAGGKFENGAATAAFGYLFNELQHYRGTSDERLRMGGYEVKDYIRYEQSTGQMYLIDGLTGSESSLGQGYAGRGVGFNNPGAQNIPNIGPIPEGLYSIGPIQDNRVRIGLPNERLMESSLRLTPVTNIGMRSGFLIHSDFGVTTASNGCICTPLTVRQAVANTGVTRLQVVK